LKEGSCGLFEGMELKKITRNM